VAAGRYPAVQELHDLGEMPPRKNGPKIRMGARKKSRRSRKDDPSCRSGTAQVSHHQKQPDQDQRCKRSSHRAVTSGENGRLHWSEE
jgi:hypothetical protein